jgi:hypothetical protein
MADGTSVFSQAGIYGAGATYPGYPGGLEFGTRVYIPSIHRLVTIHDRGPLWNSGYPNAYTHYRPHIDSYAGADCSLFNDFNGLGAHIESVFIFT